MVRSSGSKRSHPRVQRRTIVGSAVLTAAAMGLFGARPPRRPMGWITLPTFHVLAKMDHLHNAPPEAVVAFTRMKWKISESQKRWLKTERWDEEVGRTEFERMIKSPRGQALAFWGLLVISRKTLEMHQNIMYFIPVGNRWEMRPFSKLDSSMQFRIVSYLALHGTLPLRMGGETPLEKIVSQPRPEVHFLPIRRSAVTTNYVNKVSEVENERLSLNTMAREMDAVDSQ